MNAAEVHPDVTAGAAIPVGPGRADAIDLSPALGNTPPLSVMSVAKPYPRSIPQPISQPAEQSIPPAIEELVSPAAEDPVNSAVEESIPPVAEDQITLADGASDLVLAEGQIASVVGDPAAGDSSYAASKDLIVAPSNLRPIQQTSTPRFFLSRLQCPTILNTLIQRLQAKRILVHTWRVSDQCSAGQGIPPTRHRLENLDSGQIFEYIKSGGKSINLQSHPAEEQVTNSLPPPAGFDLAYSAQLLSACRKPLIVAAARRQNSTRLPPPLRELIAKLTDFVSLSVFR